MAKAASQTEARSHRGRGRLSSMEMLPEAADEALAWANAELRERRMPQVEILRRMNAMLADHGIPPVSVGTFSRYSVRVAIEARKLSAAQEATKAFLNRLPQGKRDDTTIAAIELVKVRILEMIMDEEEPDPKLLATASLTLQRLTATANNVAEGKRQDDKDQREQSAAERDEAERQAKREADQAVATVEKLASEAGLSADRVAAIRRGVLGLVG